MDACHAAEWWRDHGEDGVKMAYDEVTSFKVIPLSEQLVLQAE